MRALRVTVAAAGLATAQGAFAQSAQPIVYDCDTAAGHFSELSLPTPAPTFSVVGRLQNLAALRDKKYAPVARISISNASAPGPSDEAWSGVEYVVAPTKAGDVHMLMFSNRAKGSENKTELVGQGTKGGVDFSMTYRAGEVTATIGGKTAKTMLSPNSPVVRIVCSTGDFLFSDLRITPLP
jgi:hypothetical protein